MGEIEHCETYDRDGNCILCGNDKTLEDSVLCYKKDEVFQNIATSNAGLTATVGVAAAVNAAVPGMGAASSGKNIL